MINKHLFVLLACLFVVMIGLGIAMPVLPFYVERLALAEGATPQSVVMHVGLLTGVYALGLLILIGIAGYVIAQEMGKSTHRKIVTNRVRECFERKVAT